MDVILIIFGHESNKKNYEQNYEMIYLLASPYHTRITFGSKYHPTFTESIL